MTTKGRHLHCSFVELDWVSKQWRTCVDLPVNLISTEVNASQRKFTQGLGKRSCKFSAYVNWGVHLARALRIVIVLNPGVPVLHLVVSSGIRVLIKRTSAEVIVGVR